MVGWCGGWWENHRWCHDVIIIVFLGVIHSSLLNELWEVLQLIIREWLCQWVITGGRTIISCDVFLAYGLIEL